MKKEEFFRLLSGADEQKVAEAGAEMKHNSRRRWVKWAAMVACLALIAGVGIPLLRHSDTAQNKEPGGASGVVQSGSHSGVSSPAPANLLVVNEVNSPVSADMDVEYSFLKKLPYDVWIEVLEDFHGFTGVSYEAFIGKIPDTWECSSFYSLSTRGYKDAGLQDEYRLHDYVFAYHQTDGDGEVTIALCPFETPLRDCIVVCDDPQQSKVNGIPVVIYGFRDSYMVQFSFESVNYDMEASSITLEELEELLSGILTAPAPAS